MAWIRVEDKLPEMLGIYEVYTKDDIVTMMKFCERYGKYGWDSACAMGGIPMTGYVTHWKEPSKPPVENQEPTYQPCPKCKSIGTFNILKNDSSLYYIMCNICGYKTSVANNIKACRKKWNRSSRGNSTNF